MIDWDEVLDALAIGFKMVWIGLCLGVAAGVSYGAFELIATVMER